MATILQHGMLIDGLAKEPVADGMLIYEGKEILYAGPFCPEAAAQYPARRCWTSGARPSCPASSTLTYT